MIIGVIADTHENMPLIRKAVDYFNKHDVSLVFHAGDIISPICLTELEKLKSKLIIVFGNNDGEKKIWRQKIKDLGEIHDGFFETNIEGHKVLAIHEPYLLDALIESQKYDIIIYGHTHVPEIKASGKTLIINPGECGGWLTGKCTIALLKLPQKEAKIIEL
ncbi:MAG: metallophosphoesterase [Elusimicrobia bacterium]|nr:metallophosphoesterase [Candidatus Liberimonas magnetica]